VNSGRSAGSKDGETLSGGRGRSSLGSNAEWENSSLGSNAEWENSSLGSNAEWEK
jgi:hypothetical protein